MTDQRIENLNIVSSTRLITPEELKRTLPVSERAAVSVISGRDTVKNILERRDKRLFVVLGPCSIHDPAAAMEYGRRLQALSERVNETLYLVMRVYFEKPRSTVGWKGLINDPHMNGSFQIEEGLHIARRLLLDLAELGLPLATEALDPISPQYIQDLISWSAIGARTTESQTHREMSSGLSCTVGFKNGTDGGLAVAINALKSVIHPHNFLGINSEGQVSIVRTAGNKYVISCCEAAMASPIMIRSILPPVKKRSSRRVFVPTSWWTAATRTPARTRHCNHWLPKTWSTRSSRETSPSSG